MKNHTGMRPQDIAILFGILLKKDQNWYMKDLANELNLSQSEVSESLNRSMQTNLIDQDKRLVNRLNLKDFLFYGLKYVFPAIPGSFNRGIPAVVSAPVFAKTIHSELAYVWPLSTGTVQGISIPPLYKKLPEACQKWESLYHVMSAIDILRMDSFAREASAAKEYLEQYL